MGANPVPAHLHPLGLLVNPFSLGLSEFSDEMSFQRRPLAFGSVGVDAVATTQRPPPDLVFKLMKKDTRIEFGNTVGTGNEGVEQLL